MSSMMWGVLLAAVTVAWFVLSLVPAIHELFSRTDVAPLRIPGGRADIRHFALSFRERLESGAIPLDPEAGDHSVMISRENLELSNRAEPFGEVVVEGDFVGQAGNWYRALLVDGNATLAENSVVLRWIDVGGDLNVQTQAALWGRASAGRTMRLANGVGFQRVAASTIEIGEASKEESVAAPTARLEAPSNAQVSAGRWVIDGDFTVPDAREVDCALIVSGTLRLGRGAIVRGAVKAKLVVTGDDCVFRDAVVATREIVLGSRCEVAGPVVAERAVRAGAGCRFGSTAQPTTVTAQDIQLSGGTVLTGEVWARHVGSVAGGVDSSAESLRADRAATP
jgi:hypothetical protein